MTPALVRGCVIAVIGAESTGKTELAASLAARLNQRGIPTTLVTEYLRQWCEREGRVPQPGEQAGIAGEQMHRIAEAAKRGVVVADTTAVMTAVYSDMLFDDASLYAGAIAAQRDYAITLLTALDLPWVADGLQRDGPHVRQPVDAMVRAALARGAVPYAVVHGRGADRLASAWNALNLASQAEGRSSESWRWSCDKCSDPACEHSMFTDLLARKN
ncbi:MAG: AAA family ATPase [Janthinobacterium lividum]